MLFFTQFPMSCLSGFALPSGKGSVSCADTSQVASFPLLQNGVCARILPAAVVVPYDEEDVSYTVLYASHNEYPLSYVGGGHSYTCKSAIQDSIQISMRNFKNIHVQHNEEEGG